MGVGRNLFGVLVGIYGIWIIVSTFLVIVFNFQREAMDMYLIEVKIMGIQPTDLNFFVLIRVILGAVLISLGKWLYQSESERKR